jgi:NitT/TauT family transport system permease protein
MWSSAGVLLVLALYTVSRHTVPHWSDVLPGAQGVLIELAGHARYYVKHTVRTAVAAGEGLGIGICLGVLAGILAGVSTRLSLALSPVAIWTKATPIIALSPFLMLVLVGNEAAMPALSAALICFFPIFVNVAHGLREEALAELEYLASLRPGVFQLLWLVQIPRAAGFAIAGVKTASTLAVVGATVGEFLAPRRGIGFVILDAQQHTNNPRLLLAVLLSGLVGVTFYVGSDLVTTFIVRRFFLGSVTREGG